MVGLYAYNWHCDPPDFPLEPNVYIELTTTMLLNTKYGFDKLLEMWPTRCKYVGIYDYWAVYDWIRDRLPSGRTGNLKYVAEKLPYYVKSGICNLSAESGNSWGSQGLGFYLASRILWNSSVNTEALKKDFYEKAFGPAAKEMKAYYDHVDMANTPLVGPPFYRICIDHLEAAEKAAAGHPDILGRIEQLKEYNVYVYLLGKESDKNLPTEERRKWALETLKWNYRIRNTYMTFWVFFVEFTGTQWAKEFNEPTWNWYETYYIQKKPELIPYRDPKPITPEETAAWFQKMKADYGTPPSVSKVSFSKKLVAPEWSVDRPKPERTDGVVFQGPFTMALASMKGEALRFTVAYGTMYNKVPDAKYILTNTDGKEIARGTVPVCPKTPMPIELKVPGSGVYYLRFDDNSAGTAFYPAQEQRAAFVPEGPRGWTLIRSSWFYVPKGTTEIQFYLGGGGAPAAIRDPSGRFYQVDGMPLSDQNSNAYVFKGDGSYYVIHVPKGMDGGMWNFAGSQRALHILFFNIPTLLSLSSDGVIIPEEVAKKDELKW